MGGSRIGWLTLFCSEPMIFSISLSRKASTVVVHTNIDLRQFPPPVE
jgi:hypothetical protein